MKYTVSKLLEIAIAELGYCEKASNSQLDDKTANAGSNNYTKYARDLHNAGYYQANKNGYAWCDMFVDWCFYKLAGGKTKGEYLECQTGLYGAGCEWSSRCYRNAGRFDKNPKPGDQIFFGKTGAEEHTGIVEKVANGMVHTIEGNSSNKVQRRSYALTNSRIVGYGHPRFDEDDSGEKAETSHETATPSVSVEKGDTVKILDGATYYSGKTIPAWVKAKNWVVKECSGDRAVIDKSEDGRNAINSPINTKYLSVVRKASGNTSGGSTTTATAVTGTPSTGSDADVKAMWDYLLTKIGNTFGVAGLMGNLYAESALKSNNLQNSYESKLGYSDATYTAAVDNGSYANFAKDSAGYGLAQWTYWTRKQKLLEYAKSQKKSIGDWKMQIDFTLKELSESYKSVLNTLKSAKTVLEASNSVLLNFERPADMGSTVQQKRASYGQKYYDKYASASTTETEKPMTTPTTSAKIEVGDTVTIAQNAYYYNSSKQVPAWVRAKKWIVSSVSGSRVVINKSTDGKNAINSAIDAKYLTVVEKAAAPWTPAVGDKVLVNGTLYYTGKGTGNSFAKKNATMYICDIVNKKVYPYYIGLAYCKGGARQGWVKPDALTKK